MKEITKNQATAIWQIFFVLWLTVGSIVCFNLGCIEDSPICTPMFAITPLYLIEFYFDHPYTVQAILFQNFVLILMPALLWFLTYKSVFKNKKIRKYNYSYSYDSRHRFVSILRLIFYNRIFFHIQSLFSIVSVLHNQFNNKNRINFCNG